MLLTAPFALTGCSDNDDLTGGDSGQGTSTEAPLRTITCLAAGEGNAESGRNQVKHPTTLMSHSVLWDEGDRFQIIQDGSNDYVFDATEEGFWD